MESPLITPDRKWSGSKMAAGLRTIGGISSFLPQVNETKNNQKSNIDLINLLSVKYLNTKRLFKIIFYPQQG
jgi:hypothetical protein